MQSFGLLLEPCNIENFLTLVAEFAFNKHKEIVPLQLEAGYKPRGWVGLLVGARQYFSFSNSGTVKEKMGQLLDLLKKILRSDKTGMRVRLPKLFQYFLCSYTHTFNGPFSGTTRVSQYQKGKTNLDFTEATDSVWLWHQLGHMQVCT